MSFHGLAPRGITNSEQRELTFPAYQLMQGNIKVLIYLYNNSLNYRNQFHCAERKKSKVSKITNVSASSGPGIQAILPGFGIFFFFYQLLTKNGLDVLESRTVFVSFLKCGLFGMLGCLGYGHPDSRAPSSSTLREDQGSHLCQPSCSFLIFTRTFHVKTATLGNIGQKNDDWDLSRLVICHNEIHFGS